MLSLQWAACPSSVTYSHKIVARVQQKRLHLGVGELKEHRSLLCLDDDDSVAVDPEQDAAAVGPVSLVRGGKHGAAVQRVLHHAAQVPHFRHHLRLARPVVVVRLGQDRNPLFVGEKPRLLYPLRQEVLDVAVELRAPSVLLRVPERNLRLQTGELQRDFLRNGKFVSLKKNISFQIVCGLRYTRRRVGLSHRDYAVHCLGIQQADFDGV